MMWTAAIALLLALVDLSSAKHPTEPVPFTWNEACHGFCDRHENAKDGRQYVTSNYKVLPEYLPLWNYFNRATRRQADFDITKFLTAEVRSGDILGIGGDNYFDFFHTDTSKFTLAEPPLVQCMDMPYDDAIFDYVILSHVLSHVPEPLRCMEEVYRILKPGGIAIIVAPSTYFVQNSPDDYWRFEPASIDVLLGSFDDIILRGQWGNKEFLKYLIDHSTSQHSFYSKVMKQLADTGNDPKWPIHVWAAGQKSATGGGEQPGGGEGGVQQMGMPQEQGVGQQPMQFGQAATQQPMGMAQPGGEQLMQQQPLMQQQFQQQPQEQQQQQQPEGQGLLNFGTTPQQ